MLADDHGREVSQVRVSLTDRCNFDCTYCHNEGLGDTRGPMAPADDELTADEVVRFLEVVREFDVEAVKFTGGEPMLRADLADIVRRVPDGMETSLTTNGSFLPGRADDLAAAGLDRVNVSQDALDPEAFATITESGAYERVLAGVAAAVDAGLAPVKLNMVVFEQTAGYVPEMVEHVARNDGLQLQLIEYMPEIAGHPEWAVDIDRVHDWLAERATRIERREMHDRTRYFVEPGAVEVPDEDRVLDAALPGAASPDDPSSPDGASAADAVAPDGGRNECLGMVEIVDPVENPTFCANCHRVRVTHDGKLKGCLNRHDDHRSMGDLTRDEIRETFRETVANRVPYYGEYLLEDDGEWVLNDEYVAGSPTSAADD